MLFLKWKISHFTLIPALILGVVTLGSFLKMEYTTFIACVPFSSPLCLGRRGSLSGQKQFSLKMVDKDFQEGMMMLRVQCFSSVKLWREQRRLKVRQLTPFSF
jgi:hypothetical protein